LTRPGPWKAYGRYGSVGIELVLSIVIGFFLGRFADRRFDTAPWLSVLGLVVGVYAGFRALYKVTQHLERDVREEEDKDEEARQLKSALRALESEHSPPVGASDSKDRGRNGSASNGAGSNGHGHHGGGRGSA
jgi:uncharacterized membrane-anchored protein YhcB (DUF1043 family)